MIASDGLSADRSALDFADSLRPEQGTIRWKIPLGEVPELAAKGIKNTGTHYPKVGPVVTAGGLIFTGTRDRKVRAFDVETGKVLWETAARCGAGRHSGHLRSRRTQYIVFCAAAQVGLTPATQVPFLERMSRLLCRMPRAGQNNKSRWCG